MLNYLKKHWKRNLVILTAVPISIFILLTAPYAVFGLSAFIGGLASSFGVSFPVAAVAFAAFGTVATGLAAIILAGIGDAARSILKFCVNLGKSERERVPDAPDDDNIENRVSSHATMRKGGLGSFDNPFTPPSSSPIPIEQKPLSPRRIHHNDEANDENNINNIQFDSLSPLM